ncbi:MAG: methyltransferase domain-containing protein [Proteobacteria bacterium]|nr:methyltransferase domain-containing protein [Pseudomonadota bacterium]NBP15303.1 methyltransferase domain-containing protein [bacterium]
MERSRTFYYNLRRFHNWIKRDLINKYLKKSTVLDLASGKGGDLNKWIDAGVLQVEGYDIDVPSVLEARRRLQNTDSKNTVVNYHVQDLSKHTITEYGRQRFDAVTSMFAFHYFFEAESSLLTILETIQNNLKVGGYFVCCLFDGDLVKGKLDSGTFQTPNFRITRKSYSYDETEPYGNRIGVLMRETVLDQEMDEFVVRPRDLVGILKWWGLELVETKGFQEVYSEWESQDRRNRLNRFDQEVSFLNRYYVFKRVSDLSEKLQCIHSRIIIDKK